MKCYLLLLLIEICIGVYPIALFHGIGDGCSFKNTTYLVNKLSIALKTHVECIEIGNGYITSWFKDFRKQSEEACNKIKTNPNFQSKFSILGISQGSLIGRYVIQACDMKGEVMRYLSFDGPQMGIGSLPKITCPVICDWINYATYKLIYSDLFQKNVAPSSYYKYRYNYEQFLVHNGFLKDLNNEDKVKNESYKKRFSGLEKVLLMKGRSDSVITPVESSWFEFYDLEKGETIVPLKESRFYIEDYIGIRSLDEQGRLFLVELEGEHVIYNQTEFDVYFVPFFRD